jgi:hypothetical protein
MNKHWEEKSMKKILVLLLVSILAVSFVTGCSKKAEPVKTGLAVINSLAKSTSATADADGLAEVDSFIVAVLVGSDGKIADCKIDASQAKMNFSAAGKLTTDVTTVFKSKQELGTEYGTKGSSSISKEWNEQADFFANYVIGKTVDEVKGIAVDDKGYASGADLTAGITVHIGDFIAGVEKAVANATDLGAVEGDKLGLGVYTDMAKSTEATADAAGLAQAYSYYTASSFDKDGKITSCVIDASQGNVNFDTTGVITTDLTVAPQTKQELKEAYGMKGSSSIGKEWYEQANAFADYVKGKTVADVKGIALNAGVASDADLAASVTVHVTSFQAIIEKAYANATK